MGPSGSGKTTLLNLIGGLDRPDRGEITVAGERLDALSAGQAHEVARAARRLHLPVLQPAARADGRAQRRGAAAADEAVARRSGSATSRPRSTLVGLADRAKHKPAELSGGQQQRVAIARALVSDPSVLVCDEPTGDLDRETSDAILGLLQLLNRTHGKTIVMVTHDPRAAERASRRLYVDKGVLGHAPLGARGVKFLPLVWAGLWRKRVRTVLAMLSVAIAFWLYGTLDGVTAAFDDALVSMTSAVAAAHAEPRQRSSAGLPLAYRARIESVPGVRDVGVLTFVGGYYRESVESDRGRPRSISTAIDTPAASTSTTPTSKRCAARAPARSSVPSSSSRYGWKIGDRVTRAVADVDARRTARTIGRSTSSASTAFPRARFPADGSFWINYDYFDEERAFAKGTRDVLHAARRRRRSRRRDRRRDRRAVRELGRRDADAERAGFLSARRSSASATSASS